jgi:hypothetical protein
MVAFAIATPPAASAEPPRRIHSYPVAFTGGIGVYLRSAPNDKDSSRVYAVPDGTLIPVECETTGTSRTNSYGQTSDVYVRSPGGVYVASVYLDNGVVGRSSAPDCDALDTSRTAHLNPKTVGDRLRGGDAVVYTQDGPKRIRAYFSHTKTAEVASVYGAASNITDSVNNSLCAVAGLMITIATDGAASLVLGTTGGLACGALSHNEAAPIAAVAKSADQHGKCLELRMHRDGARWVADDNGWTMTDHRNYCG